MFEAKNRDRFVGFALEMLQRSVLRTAESQTGVLQHPRDCHRHSVPQQSAQEHVMASARGLGFRV